MKRSECCLPCCCQPRFCPDVRGRGTARARRPLSPRTQKRTGRLIHRRKGYPVIAEQLDRVVSLYGSFERPGCWPAEHWWHDQRRH